tara:strand:+ start:403 stop:633 length:231 start_codon:yes stop_codon:yes gene_type:complete
MPRKLLKEAKAELDEAKRKELYSQMGRMLNEEGGLILPMFNDFINGVGDKLAGWQDDPYGEMMSNQAHIECWLKDA